MEIAVGDIVISRDPLLLHESIVDLVTSHDPECAIRPFESLVFHRCWSRFTFADLQREALYDYVHLFLKVNDFGSVVL